MNKEYRVRIGWKIFCIILALFGLLMAFGMQLFLAGLILFVCAIYFALFTFSKRIIVTDDYLMSDTGIMAKLKLAKLVRINWDSIVRIARVNGKINVYCKNEKWPVVLSMVDNDIDLIKEVAKRTHNAVIDNTIKDLLNTAPLSEKRNTNYFAVNLKNRLLIYLAIVFIVVILLQMWNYLK
jgi:hypothetical protein